MRKIATFNVNGLTSRLPRVLEWLAESAPDVACLQELKTPSERFPLDAVEAAGYRAVWHGQKAWNGVAILARGTLPIETGRGLPGDPEDTQSRYLEAMVDGLLIACLYLPNGNPQPGPKFDYKLKWMDRLIAHAQELIASGMPVVMLGDFNVVATDLVQDIYNPRSWRDDALLQPGTRAAWRRLLAQGWTDAIAARHPGAPMYTFWDYFRNSWARDAGLRIDHLLLSPSLAPQLVDAGVDRHVRGWETPSDHAPAWVTLEA